jgi:hypothetical protein
VGSAQALLNQCTGLTGKARSSSLVGHWKRTDTGRCSSNHHLVSVGDHEMISAMQMRWGAQSDSNTRCALPAGLMPQAVHCTHVISYHSPQPTAAPPPLFFLGCPCAGRVSAQAPAPLIELLSKAGKEGLAKLEGIHGPGGPPTGPSGRRICLHLQHMLSAQPTAIRSLRKLQSSTLHVQCLDELCH